MRGLQSNWHEEKKKDSSYWLVARKMLGSTAVQSAGVTGVKSTAITKLVAHLCADGAAVAALLLGPAKRVVERKIPRVGIAREVVVRNGFSARPPRSSGYHY